MAHDATMSLLNMTTNDTISLMNMKNWNMTDHSNRHNNLTMDNDTMNHTGSTSMTHDVHDQGMDPTEALGSLDQEPFCIGGMHSTHFLLGGGSNGMVMYMDGFRVSLKGGQPCLNLYFPGWTLDTRGKFVWAMIGVLALAIVTEGISKLRFMVPKKLNGNNRLRHNCRWSITVLLHGLQAFVGYVLMLATMTFSVELFISVLTGLGIGYAIFYDEEDTHVTTNPCCNFIQNEADERLSTHKTQDEETMHQKEDCEQLTTEVDYGVLESRES